MGGTFYAEKKLSTKQKAIGAAILIVVLLAAAWSAYKSHQHTEYLKDTIIKGLFTDYTFYSPFDEDTQERYTEFFNEGIRKKSIRKALAEVVSEQTEIALNNTKYYDASESEREEQGLHAIEDAFGEECTLSGLQSMLPDVIGAISDLGYQDEALRDNLLGFYEQKRQYTVDYYTATSDTDELDYDLASGMESNRKALDEFNRSADEFYQIDAEALYPVSELKDHYTQAVELAYEQEDKKQLAEALSAATESEYVSDETYLDSQQIIDFFASDATDVATTVNGIGGYYDTQDPNNSYNYYGDFYFGTRTSGGKRYDTSAFTPGLWSALTPGQRSEIRSGNSSHTTTYRYFRGQGIDSFAPADQDDPDKYQYAFVIPGEEPGFVYVSPQSICLDLSGIAQLEIAGDFQDSFEEAKQTFAATHGAKTGTSAEKSSAQ